MLQSAFRAAGGKWSTFIIWAKNTFTLGRADYQRQYEPILYGWPEGATPLVRRPRSGRRLEHQEAAEERSAPDDEAGGTGRAGDPQFEPPGNGARSLRRLRHDADRRREVQDVARLIELDPKYVDVIVRRWRGSWAGQTASIRGQWTRKCAPVESARPGC